MRKLLTLAFLLALLPVFVIAQAEELGEDEIRGVDKSGAQTVAGAVLVLGLVVLGYLYGKKKLAVRSLAFYSIVLAAAIGIGYSLYEYSAAEQGCAIPVGDQVALHCHYTLYIEICGDQKELPWEQGTDLHHTHKGSFYIHTHPNPIPLAELEHLTTLGIALRDLGIMATQDSIEDPETGIVYEATADSCNNGTDDVLYVTVRHENGEEEDITADWLNYSYEDEDKIFIRYG